MEQPFLEDCPFCGRLPKLIRHKIDFEGYWNEYSYDVVCRCGAGFKGYSSKKRVIEKWNTRSYELYG